MRPPSSSRVFDMLAWQWLIYAQVRRPVNKVRQQIAFAVQEHEAELHDYNTQVRDAEHTDSEMIWIRPRNGP